MKRKNIQNSNGISVCDSIVMSVKNKRVNLRKPFSAVIALLGFASVILSFVGMFDINYSHSKIFFASCIFAAAYMLMSVIEGKALWLLAGSLVLYMIGAIKKISDISLGFKYVYNIIYKTSFKTTIEYYKGLEPALEIQSVDIMMFFYIWLLAIVIFFFTIYRPNPILPLLVTFPVLEIGLYNGIELPVLRGIMVIAYWLALLGMCTIDIGEYSGGQSGFVRKNNLFFPKRHMKLKVTEKCGAFIMASVIIVAVISSAFLKVTHYKRSDEINEKRRNISEAAESFNIDNIAESLAALSNALGFDFKYENHKLGTNDHVSYKNDTDLILDVQYKPESAVYLKDYSGSVYHDNQWFDLDDEAYKDSRLTDCSSFKINPQDFPSVFAPIVLPNTAKTNLRIQSKLKSKKTLAPYAADSLDTFTYDKDKMLTSSIDNSRDFSYTFVPLTAESVAEKMGSLTRGSYSISSIADLTWRDLINGYCTMNGLISNNDLFTIDHELVAPDEFLYNNGMILMGELLENSYKSFVYDNYLDVPQTEAMQEIRDAYADVLSSADASTAKGRIELLHNIRNKITSESTYSLYPGKTPSNRDFANYFLLENHKGYCIHYATSGVILARMAGIPARYATGYVVVGDDFNSKTLNSDGTYTIEVKDNRSHAWAEVFIDGFGWVPFEFTAGYSNSSIQPVTTQTTTTTTRITTKTLTTSVSNGSKQISSTTRTTAVPKMSATTSVKPSSYFRDQNGKPSELALLLIKVLKLVIAAALTVGAVLLRRYMILKVRQNRFSEGKSSDRVGYIYGYAEKLLTQLSFDTENGKYNEFAKDVEDRLANRYFKEGAFKSLTSTALRTRFGNKKPSNEELAECRKTVESIANRMYKDKGYIGKLYMKYIQVLI